MFLSVLLPLLLLLAMTSHIGLATAAAPVSSSFPAPPSPYLGPRRIVGGNSIKAATQFPFMAGLVDEDEKGVDCGGAILSETKILTAGHCVSEWDRGSATSRVVRVGALKYNAGGELAPVLRWDLHPKFKNIGINSDYDVAIITLAKALTLSPTIQTIPLVAEGTELTKWQDLKILGWGYTWDSFYADSSPSDGRLKQATVRPSDLVACFFAYKPRNAHVTNRMFCATGKKQGACNGDSGGPVVNPKTGRLVGTISWSIGCALKEYPDVIVDLAHPEIHDWISKEAGLVGH